MRKNKKISGPVPASILERKKVIFFYVIDNYLESDLEQLQKAAETVLKATQKINMLLISRSGTIPTSVRDLVDKAKSERIEIIISKDYLSHILGRSMDDGFVIPLHRIKFNSGEIVKDALNRQDEVDILVFGRFKYKNNSLPVIICKVILGVVQRLMTPIFYENAFLSPIIIPAARFNVLDEIDFSKPLLSQHYDLVLASKNITPVFEGKSTNNDMFKKQAFSLVKVLQLSVTKRIEWFILRPFKEIRKVSLIHPDNSIYRFLYTVLAFALLMLMCILSFDYGITWDEKIQYEYAKDILNYYLTLGEDRTVFDTSRHLYNTMLYYGSSFDLLTVAINRLFNIVDNEYATRHLLNALAGFFGMFYTGMIAKHLSGNWRTAFFALILIALTPTFWGHSMNNPKDIPFAAAMTFSFYQLIKFIDSLPNPGFTRISLLIFGIGAAIGVRVGGILIVAFLGLFMALSWALQFKRQGLNSTMKLIWPYCKAFFITAIGGYLLGLLFWPYGLENPITHPYLALKGFSNVNYLVTYELFDGKRIWMNEVPWYYTLKFIGITVPLIVLVGAICTLVVSFIGTSRKQKGDILMLLFIFLFPILYAINQDSMLYNGWRHFLFVYPVIVVMAAFFWNRIMELSKRKLLVWSMLVVFIFANLKVLAWMIRSHPNQYVYFNELVGGIEGAYGNYETDYYSNSLKQAANWLCENELTGDRRIKIVTNNEPLTGQYYIDKCHDSADVVWTREYELSKQFSDYALFTTRTMTHEQLTNGSFPPKGTIHTVEVDGVPLCAVVKRENQFIPMAYEHLEQRQPDSALYYLSLYNDYDSMNEEAYRIAGLCYLNKGTSFYDSSEKFLNRSIDLYPENFMAWDLKGQVYFNRGDYAKAETFFAKSIEYKINYTSAHYNRGITLLNTGNYVGAAEEFKNSIKYGGHKFEFYKLLGMAYLNMNNHDDALQYLGYALHLRDNDAEVYNMIGQAYQAKGDENTAYKYFSRAQKLMGS